MQIVLYKNTSENNRVDKNLTNVITLDGYLREGSNLIAPSFSIQYVDPTSFNYAYIPEFKRYYYIVDINIEYNNILSLSLEVDVLMSFAEQIKALSGVISRQEFLFNLYLNDDNIQGYCNEKIYALPFDGEGFQDTLHNILVVSGGDVGLVPGS